MSRLTPAQLAALAAVADGRVDYGDPWPAAVARRFARAQTERRTTISGAPRPPLSSPAACAVPFWRLDGHDVYGQENRTYGSLAERGLILAACAEDGGLAQVQLSDDGRAQLDRYAAQVAPCCPSDDQRSEEHCPGCGAHLGARIARLNLCPRCAEPL